MDTCCIDTTNKAEYSWAIQSMFCYRWFTRGWTLQELLAPSIITTIPSTALQGVPLSDFNVHDRILWNKHWKTKVPTDRAYSLIGILGVSLLPFDGESLAEAMKRITDEVEKQNMCIKDIRHTDPRDNKKRIEDTKGGLLVDSYRWQLRPDSRLLWVKGDPGKGKTMLLCDAALLSYFFCQETDSRINSATAVLRGLLYMLVHQQPSLVLHIRKKHDHAGKSFLSTTYLIIDALDECVTDRPKLLGFIAKQLGLELNANSVAVAVKVFIQQKVSQLAQEKRNKLAVRDAVLYHLTSNANDTFLWVALDILKKLALFPPRLNSLYMRMLQQICESDNAEICLQVLAVTAVLYRPVTVAELVALVEQLDYVADLEPVREISAKDFLFTKALGKSIFSKSKAILSRTLHRNMYSLEAPGSHIDNVETPELDPLSVLRYSCVYWIDHLCNSKPNSSTNSAGGLQVLGAVHDFLTKKYLYWLEGLSLCKNLGRGVVSMARLGSLVQLVYDAQRFVMSHKQAIESYPLQTYASALLFNPTGSLTRQLFPHEKPEGITIWPAMSDSWSACLQTLEGHSSTVRSVAFSHDSTWLASASWDRTIKIWDASSGACLQMLEGHSSTVTSVAFLHNSTRLASASWDRTIKIWDASSGACLQTLKGHSDAVSSVAFLHNSTRLALASWDRTIKIWDTSSVVASIRVSTSVFSCVRQMYWSWYRVW
ncbi:hypothetical protein CC86DRAFT_394952 [Ophiobolus disseminans]|uniref:Mitochondrial division protein 1 n=1 Tax=Ophiobolus disseminans TaxID=1469910 RepID=A0A6A6ZX36_9PLEO|nr:hypothetical protein CC86DRAFT_394952 [Ophiobolus disseminans]